MTSISKSIVANGLSKAIIGVLNIVVVPFYIRYLGMEAYGLVGFYTMLQTIFVVLDLGISLTLTRSLSQLSLSEDQAQKSRDLARTLELIYWSLALLAGLAIALVTPLLVHGWVKADQLSQETLYRALIAMAIALTFLFPVGFYTAGLVGLQRQVEQSVVNAVQWIVRCAGALVVLHFATEPLMAFFLWQAGMSFVAAFSMRYAFWRFLPRTDQRTRPRKAHLQAVARFATGMSVMSILLLLFNQADKVIMSKRLSLTEFGYYSIAWQVAGVLFLLYMPIYTAYFPVFAQRVVQAEREKLSKSFHESCQLMSVMVFPVVLVVAVFAPEILMLWTRKPDVVEHAGILVRILIPGATAAALLYMPWAIQQAYGDFKAGIRIVFIGICLVVPTVLVLSSQLGAKGGAISWMAVAMLQALALLGVVFKTSLPGEWRKWLFVDVARPLLACLLLVGAARYVWPSHLPNLVQFAGLFGLFLVLLFVSAITVPATSLYLKKKMKLTAHV